MEDLTDYFISVIKQSGSIDIAESEFKRTISEDDDLRAKYREWCHQVGSSEKRGFLDFCDEYLASQDSVWDSLSDYDE
ncbi:MAG: hypothetical protein ACI30K_07880 [Muribaculaceae bacterium]